MTKTGLVFGTAAFLLVIVSGVSARDFRGEHHRSSARNGHDHTGGWSRGGFTAEDPGVQSGDPHAGDPLPGLTDSQLALFNAGKARFEVVQGVGNGLGPRFNLNGCATCHMQPAVGGTSPPVNPQVAIATAFGARNDLPFFIEENGPVREARFKYLPDGERDGNVHNLFVISGRIDGTGDASGCDIRQPNFYRQAGRDNLIFRIPTPVFGAGLVEQVPDSVILDDHRAHHGKKSALGIKGRPNRIRVAEGATNLGSDNTIARFGWKAQNKSLLAFAGEAYNVEMGITNELFQTERDEKVDCQLAATPNDVTRPDAAGLDMLSDINTFAAFMRFLAPPAPSSTTPGGKASIDSGRILFEEIGCALCHTPTLTTGNNATVDALNNQPVPLYSDLLLHNMGPGLADDIVQWQAGPHEFRTAPLWGLGERIFFLHDGRTADLLEAISAHESGSGADASEANAVIRAFNRLDEEKKQDLLNFLRSL